MQKSIFVYYSRSWVLLLGWWGGDPLFCILLRQRLQRQWCTVTGRELALKLRGLRCFRVLLDTRHTLHIEHLVRLVGVLLEGFLIFVIDEIMSLHHEPTLLPLLDHTGSSLSMSACAVWSQVIQYSIQYNVIQYCIVFNIVLSGRAKAHAPSVSYVSTVSQMARELE